MSILHQIVETKKQELAAALAAVPLEQMKARALAATPPRNFFAALTKNPPQGGGGGMVNVIAEIKQRSPSAGNFKNTTDFNPAQIAETYHLAGADALSVLTAEQYFGGKLEYLQLVKNAV